MSWPAWRSTPNRSSAPPRPWGARSPRTSAASLSPNHRQRPPMYLGMDGTGVPMRLSELEGRAGKQPDGSAKTREVKLVTVWSAEGRDDKGIPVGDPGSGTYSAAIESAAGRGPAQEVP